MEISPGVTKDFSGRYILDETTKKLISAKIQMEANAFLTGKVKAVIQIEAH